MYDEEGHGKFITCPTLCPAEYFYLDYEADVISLKRDDYQNNIFPSSVQVPHNSFSFGFIDIDLTGTEGYDKIAGTPLEKHPYIDA